MFGHNDMLSYVDGLQSTYYFVGMKISCDNVLDLIDVWTNVFVDEFVAEKEMEGWKISYVCIFGDLLMLIDIQFVYSGRFLIILYFF